MAECKFTAGEGDCTFNSILGKVTLSVEATDGSTIRFQKASYNKVDIPGLPASTISFTVVTGKADLAVVYSFSDPANGKGVLKEECDGHTKLKQVSAKEPSPVYSVCGEGA